MLWQATIERNPESWMSYNNLGHILLDRNLPEESEAFLRQCLEIKPDHFNAMSNLAEALRRQKRDSEALIAINKAIDLGDGLVESGRRPSRAFLAKEYHQLGLILMAIKHARQAERAYMTSLELEPDRPPVNFSYAQLLMERERFEEARKHFLIYLDWNPGDLVALDSMGQIAEDQERYADAKMYYRRAVDAAQSPQDQVAMASNYIRFISSCPDPTVRRIEEGIAMAENMNRASRGQMPEVLDVLAAAYAQGGRFDDAVKVCESALQLARAAGRYEIATEIESRLERYRNQKVFWE
ncbi:MAG: tetratricopeptide repeat protein [Planctomycetes bacterium]|nr:tetratricopeptide repeat protein [Planctomycetota bacterium]